MKRAFALILLLPSVALAWNKTGHQVAGSIAYRSMTPEARTKVVKILKAHPYYPTWQKKLDAIAEADRDEALFQFAGTWADDIRRTEFDHPTWHYVDVPYRRGEPDGTLPTEESAVTAFKLNVEKLKTTTGADQAIALTWVFHLAEDIHMPLHATMLFSPELPKGDKGGNLFYVKFPGGARRQPISTPFGMVCLGLMTNSRHATARPSS